MCACPSECLDEPPQSITAFLAIFDETDMSSLMGNHAEYIDQTTTLSSGSCLGFPCVFVLALKESTRLPSLCRFEHRSRDVQESCHACAEECANDGVVGISRSGLNSTDHMRRAMVLCQLQARNVQSRIVMKS